MNSSYIFTVLYGSFLGYIMSELDRIEDELYSFECDRYMQLKEQHDSLLNIKNKYCDVMSKIKELEA